MVRLKIEEIFGKQRAIAFSVSVSKTPSTNKLSLSLSSFLSVYLSYVTPPHTHLPTLCTSVCSTKLPSSRGTNAHKLSPSLSLFLYVFLTLPAPLSIFPQTYRRAEEPTLRTFPDLATFNRPRIFLDELCVAWACKREPESWRWAPPFPTRFNFSSSLFLPLSVTNRPSPGVEAKGVTRVPIIEGEEENGVSPGGNIDDAEEEDEGSGWESAGEDEAWLIASSRGRGTLEGWIGGLEEEGIR